MTVGKSDVMTCRAAYGAALATEHKRFDSLAPSRTSIVFLTVTVSFSSCVDGVLSPSTGQGSERFTTVTCAGHASASCRYRITRVSSSELTQSLDQTIEKPGCER